jgi:hypothetical protein
MGNAGRAEGLGSAEGIPDGVCEGTGDGAALADGIGGGGGGDCAVASPGQLARASATSAAGTAVLEMVIAASSVRRRSMMCLRPAQTDNPAAG